MASPSNSVTPLQALLVIGAAVGLGWCFLRKPEPAATIAPVVPPVAAAPPAPVAQKAAEPAEVLPADDAARDVAAVLKAVHPLACKAAGANNDWAKCHDETKGFQNVLRCAQAARAKAKAAASRFPADTARSTCGKAISSASRGVAETTAKMFDDLVAWLEKHRTELSGPMANATIGDACETVSCDDQPSEFAEGYEAASYARVMAVNCTKPLFQCGNAGDNVCWINKVAARLGVACDGAENKTDSPLSVRATGTTIR